MTRFTPKGSAPIFWIVRQFRIFPQFIFLNFLTIAYSYIVHSRYPVFPKIVNYSQNFQILTIPDFSRTVVRAGKTWKTNKCFLELFFQKLSTGWVGLYTIFKVRPVDNFCEKIITGFHAVKRDRANLLLFKSALL